MLVDEFRSRAEFLYRMTAEFADAVPDDRWEFSPVPPHIRPSAPDPSRHGEGFAPFCKQLRHVIGVRGVYTAGLLTGKIDFSRKHEHYRGPLTRPALLAGLQEQHDALLAALDGVDTDQTIDFFGRPLSFAAWGFTVIQHEAIHHGQWSVYAELAGFPTPLLWRREWGL